MASLTVVAVALSVAAPFYLPSSRISYSGSQSPIWTSAFVLACWVIGLLFYNIVLYPIFFTPFKHLPVPVGRSFWNGHFDILDKPYEGRRLTIWTKRYPNSPFIRIYSMFNKEILLANSEKAVADILVHKDHDFEKLESVRFLMRKISGNGLFLAQGDEHRAQRKLLNPAFSKSNIQRLLPIFWWASMEMVAAIKTSIEQGEKIIRMKDWSSRTTLDIMGRAAISLDFGSIHNPHSKLHEEYRKLFKEPEGFGAIFFIMIGTFFPSLLGSLPTPEDRALGSGDSFIEMAVRDIFEEKKKKSKKNSSASNGSVDILTIYMQSGDVSDKMLTQHLRTLLAAGHESTASSFLWCIYAMCKFPQVQQRLRSEVRSHLPPFDPTDTSFAPPLDSLTYLKAFCNEVLRFYPPVPSTSRVAVRDTSVAGLFIPKGTELVIGHEAMNHSTELWGSDAQEFNVDRWLAPGCSNTGGASTNYANMTFLHGPHNCIGMGFSKTEMEILVAVMVGSFEIEFADPNAKLERKGLATLTPTDGVPVKLKVLEGW